MGRLAAIAAVFGASAGLDGQETAHLYGIGIKIGSMDAVGAKEKVVERQIIDNCGVGCGYMPPIAVRRVWTVGMWLHLTKTFALRDVES